MSGQSDSQLWIDILTGERGQEILTAAMTHVAQNLSIMTGREITIEDPSLEIVPLNEVIEKGGSPEAETVGVYLLIEGDLSGQSLLVFGIRDALYLVDMMMGDEPGTATEMDDLAQSAMAEIGNVGLASFLNIVSEEVGKSILPSPPAVIIDMAASIMQAVMMNSMMYSTEYLIILNSTFKDAGRVIQAGFWVLPNPENDILKILSKDA